ncbi:MAG TPA: hypothetical protein VJ301_06065, partial [Propionibacteriaceae bacterium]|nr:hypothetical protein [Propionibacteriaceae bacterium]
MPAHHPRSLGFGPQIGPKFGALNSFRAIRTGYAGHGPSDAQFCPCEGAEEAASAGLLSPHC